MESSYRRETQLRAEIATVMTQNDDQWLILDRVIRRGENSRTK